VANYGRQKIISMPRAVPKIAIFEEAARTLDIPGGTKMIQEYYLQMRKFGCNILAVIQQYDIIKESAVRGAMIGNSNELLNLKVRWFSKTRSIKVLGSGSGNATGCATGLRRRRRFLIVLAIRSGAGAASGFFFVRGFRLGIPQKW
jgi:hypothetical protein